MMRRMGKPKHSDDRNRGLEDALAGRLGPEDKRRLEEAQRTIRDLVEKVMPDGSSFEEYERAVLEITNEIARKELERKLQAIADSHPPAMVIDHNNDWHGVREGTAFNYRRHLPGTVAYHSLVGPLWIRRYSYRECYRNGCTYVPLELDAGLMEHMTPCLGKAVAFAFSQMPVRQVESMLSAAGRRAPSRATLDRSAKDIGAYALTSNDEIEPLVRAEETIPPGTRAIALGLDRTAVAMRAFDGIRVETEPGIHSSRPKSPRREPYHASGVKWRMDYVATVSFVDRKGERLDSRQYRLASEWEPERVVDRMMADLRQALAQKRSLKVVIVQDGAPELWKVMRAKLKEELADGRWDEVLDWYHADEHISACLNLSTSTPEQRKEQRKTWHALLMSEESDVGKAFLRSLRRFGKRLGSESTEKREKFEEHVQYFSKNRARLAYAGIRRKGLPIGSGITEGACKSLVGTRAKRSGQHWTQRGLSSALHLRAVVESNRFDAYWDHFAARYRATSMTPM